MMINDNFFKCVDIISASTVVVNEMIKEATPEVDKIFGFLVQEINALIKEIKDFTREIFIIERYIICEKAKELYPTLEDLPSEIKKQVIKYREEDDICLFTMEPCTCNKEAETLVKRMNSFLENIQRRRDKSSDLGVNLSDSLEKMKNEFAVFSNNISKIIEIAEKVDLISINAYVEAARMGNKGKGFEIIAENIRKAAIEIQDLGRSISLHFQELDETFKKNTELFNNFKDFEEESKIDDQKESEQIRKNILRLVNNFVKFVEFTSSFSHRIFDRIHEIQNKLTQKFQYIDINNQRIQNIGTKLNILTKMIEEIVKYLNKERNEEELTENFKEMEEQFKKVATVYREVEITAEKMDYDLSTHHETVGEKLEDVEGDIELF